MQTTDLLIAALQNHVTVESPDSLRFLGLLTITVDQDVMVPTLPYSVEYANIEAMRIAGNTYRSDLDDHGEEPSVIGAGSTYLIGDPDTDSSMTTEQMRRWPLALLDPHTLVNSEADDRSGVYFIGLNPPLVMTHRDIETKHVSLKYFTLLDLLVYAAAQDAKAAGRMADVERLLALTSPNYGIRLDPEQTKLVLSRLHDLKPIMQRGSSNYTSASGASTWKNTETISTGEITHIGVKTGTVLMQNDAAVIDGVKVPFVLNSATMKLFRIMGGIYMEHGGRPDKYGRADVVTNMAHILELKGQDDTAYNRRAIRQQFEYLWGGLRFGVRDPKTGAIDAITAIERVNTKNANALRVIFTHEFTKAYWGVHAPLQADDPALYKTNDTKNPNAFPIGVYMINQMTTNVGRSQQYRLGVARVLNHCKAIVSHEDAMKNRHGDKRIKHLQRDLDHLVEIGFLKEWHYCHSGGTPIGSDEMGKGGLLSYDAVIRAMTDGHDDTFIEWTPAHPYQGHMLSRQDAIEASKAKRAEEAERKAERRRTREEIADRKAAEMMAKRTVERSENGSE